MPEATFQRFVVKIGTSVLTDESGRLMPSRIEGLAGQVASCAKTHRQPLIVSSGAIAYGMAKLGLTKRPKALAQLQACAAIGQSELMRLYTRALLQHGLLSAQILLTEEDLASAGRYKNAKQTLLTLLHRQVVPIVNENDTVAVEEITFGDNDRLAALVASAVEAQLLVILTDVEGLLRDGKLIERIDALDSSQFGPVHGKKRQLTKGGISSKLEAARIVGHHGIPMVIANGASPTALTELIEGKPVGTLFVPPRNRLSPRKRWIAFSLRQPNGELTIDAGAAEALLEKGKSLLPSGVLQVKGKFEAGECVTIRDAKGGELARGVSNLSSSELGRIRGMKTGEAAQVLGQSSVREVVHRDHMVLAREVRA